MGLFFRPLAVPFVKIFFAAQTDKSGWPPLVAPPPPPPFALRYVVMPRTVYRSGSVDSLTQLTGKLVDSLTRRPSMTDWQCGTNPRWMDRYDARTRTSCRTELAHNLYRDSPLLSQ